MRDCVFCLEKVKNKFIRDCRFCPLENLCMECWYKHEKKHSNKPHIEDFRKLGYDNTACEMLDSLYNFREDKTEGNNIGMM